MRPLTLLSLILGPLLVLDFVLALDNVVDQGVKTPLAVPPINVVDVSEVNPFAEGVPKVLSGYRFFVGLAADKHWCRRLCCFWPLFSM